MFVAISNNGFWMCIEHVNSGIMNRNNHYWIIGENMVINMRIENIRGRDINNVYSVLLGTIFSCIRFL